MKLSKALKIKVLMPMITTAFEVSFDGRCYNRAIVYVGTTSLLFRVKKIDGAFRMWIFVLDTQFCDSYIIKNSPSRPSREDCYEEFLSFLNNNQELSERVFGHRIGSFWGDYPQDVYRDRSLISALQYDAWRRRMVWAGHRG